MGLAVLGNVCIIPGYPPDGRRQQAGQQPQQGGFAGPVRPAQHHRFPRLHLQVEAGKNRPFAPDDAEALCRQHDRQSTLRPPRPSPPRKRAAPAAAVSSAAVPR